MKYLKWHTTGPSEFVVKYTFEMEGGGTTYAVDYATVLQEKYPFKSFNKVYEWCSGPGFIGFDLLDHGIAKSLCLSDVYLPALDCAKKTAQSNSIESCVTTYLLDDLTLLPMYEQFNLVVGNPPHHSQSIHEEYHRNRIVLDNNWQAHLNFFQNIGKHLLPNGIILLQENLSGSTVKTFEKMVSDNNLQITDWFTSKDFFSSARNNFIYYIEIQHKN